MKLSPLALFAAMAVPSYGALLVRETFDAYATGDLNGDASSATGVTGNFGMAGSGSVFNANSGSLAFSTYSTTGGNRMGVGFDTSGSALTVQISSTLPAGSTTVWGTYLVRYNSSSLSTLAEALSGVRLGPTATSNTAAAYLQSLGNNVGVADGLPGVGYAGTTSAPVTGSTAVTANSSAVFMVLSRYTNVGVAGGGTATQWVLTENQYASLLATNFADLNTRMAGTGTSEVRSLATDTSTTTVDFTGFLQIAGRRDTVAFDEIRFGTELVDVITPIPEPGIVALSSLGALALIRRRR